jgi:hypothetical protein
MKKPVRRLATAKEDSMGMLVPLSAILLNSSAEMLRMATLVRSVEDAIFDSSALGGTLSSPSTGNLHQLDFLLQTLTELSGVFCRLAETEGSDAAVNTGHVVDPVKLAHLREALIRSPHTEQPHDRPSTEDIELF